MSTLLWAGAVNGDPEYQSQVLRHGTSVLMGPAPSGRLFGAKSGVRDGVGPSIITLTSTTWTVGAHPGVIDEADQADRGAYSYDFGGQSGDLTAADSTNKRVDRLDMQFVQGDGTTSSDSLQVVYTAGVAAANPTAPTAPDNSFPLAEIDMPKLGGSVPTFRWTAPTFVAGVGSAQYTQTQAQGIGGNTWVTLVYMGGSTHDDLGLSYGNGVFTVPAGGRFRVSADVCLIPADSDVHTLGFRLTVGGSPVVTVRTAGASGTVGATVAIPARLVDLDAGAQLSLQVYHSDIGASTSTGSYAARLTIERV